MGHGLVLEIPRRMMRICIYCLLPVCILSCNRQLAIIEGSLPDTSYDGELVYLVPVKGATVDNVDSTYISRGAFRFESAIGKGGRDVCIIRTRPLLRLKLQELIVIKEAGRLQVKLDSVSSASGTALNDSLQLWKEQKEQAGSDYAGYTFRFVMHNKANAAGRFVYELSKYLFTPEQRQELQMPD
jgi:hypothetical protein